MNLAPGEGDHLTDERRWPSASMSQDRLASTLVGAGLTAPVSLPYIELLPSVRVHIIAIEKPLPSH
jgi:hypothetical protein